jgi:hypothetical protein
VVRGNFSEQEKKALGEAIDEGITRNNMIRQITGQVSGGFGSRWEKLVSTLAIPFSGMETFNRKSAFLAMYRVATKEQGLSHEAAFEKSINYINNTHYLYGKANLPAFARGGSVASAIGKTAYVFRSFTHNYLLSMIQSLHGPDGKIALDVVGRSLGYLALFGGAASLPFLDDLLEQLEQMTGTPYRKNMREALKGIGGDLLAKFGMEGLPALIGVDLSGSLKIGLPKLSLKGAEESAIGVSLGLLDKANKTIEAMARGDIERALESSSPVFIENALKAVRRATEGATTPKGKVLFDAEGNPLKLSAAEAIGQAAGFRPERMSESSQTHRVLSNIETHWKEVRDNLTAKFRMASPEDRSDVLKKIERYNLDVQKFGGSVPMIRRDSLRNALRQRPGKADMRFEQTYQ